MNNRREVKKLYRVVGVDDLDPITLERTPAIRAYTPGDVLLMKSLLYKLEEVPTARSVARRPAFGDGKLAAAGKD